METVTLVTLVIIVILCLPRLPYGNIMCFLIPVALNPLQTQEQMSSLKLVSCISPPAEPSLVFAESVLSV